MMSALSPRSPFTANSNRLGPTRAEVQLRVMLAALVLAIAGLLYFLVGATGRTPEARQRELQALEAQQRELQARVAELRMLTVRVQSATKSSQEFAADNFLGRTNAFSMMIKNLEELAVKNKLRSSSISYDLLNETNELGWTGVEVKLDLEGEYTNLIRYVNSVEKARIFWIIRGLDVAGDPAIGLRLRLTAETYLLPGQG